MSFFFCTKSTLQKLLIIISLVVCNNIINAKTLSGYIITNNQDTIEGIIKVYHNKMLKYGYLVPEIDLESQFDQLVFKENGAKRFKTYLPKDISGFSFKYNDKTIQFQSFRLESHSMIRREKFRYRFLLLLCRKNKSLYLNQSRIYKSTNLINSSGYSEFMSHIYKDYYLYDEANGLHKLTNGNIRAFLISYGIEPEFLNNYDGPVDMYNLAYILEVYYSKSRIIKQNRFSFNLQFPLFRVCP